MNNSMMKTDDDILTMSQRVGQVLLAGMMLLLLCFFGYHQFANTGFFTAKFGLVEMLCLYGPIVLALAAPLSRALNGRRNPARLLEAIANLSLAIGCLWLLNVFPFNYAHLADPLPFPFHFVIAWITDDLARIFLVLQILIALITSVVLSLKYLISRPALSNAPQSG